MKGRVPSQRRIAMAERKRIAAAVETLILTRSARRCCLCYQLERDFTEKYGQIAHLDRNASNDAEDNLAFLCLPHHSEYDSTTSQHKNYTVNEVKASRALLYAEVGKRRPCEWVLVLDGQFSDFDKARVEAIIEHLRKMLDDPHLTMKRMEAGSIRFVIESSENSFDKAQHLRESHELNEIGGMAILDIQKLVTRRTGEQAVNDLSEDDLNALKADIVREIEALDDAEFARFAKSERSFLDGVTRIAETSAQRLGYAAGNAVLLSQVLAAAMVLSFQKGFMQGFAEGLFESGTDERHEKNEE